MLRALCDTRHLGLAGFAGYAARRLAADVVGLPLELDDVADLVVGAACLTTGAWFRRRDGRGRSSAVVLRTAIADDFRAVQRIAATCTLVAGIALDCVDLRSIHFLHKAGVGAVVNRRTEENLIAHLRVGREELPLLLVILRRPSAARAAGTLRLAKQPQGVLITERGHKAPVHEHIAPFVAVLLSVVPLRVLFVEVSGVLCPVRATGVGGLTVELTVGRLFDVAEFADCDGDHGRD